MADIKRVTVLGSGVMGHGIAQITASAGYDVALRDIKREFLDRAMDKIEWSLNKMATKGRISPEQKSTILSRISPVVDINDAVADSDLIIEVVPENMNLKRTVYAELDAIASPDTIFASNTSTLPITEIAGATNRKDMVIGVHFFNPPQLMKLVEIIPGSETSKDIVDMMESFVSSLGKTPVVCRQDVPGFIVNRLFIPMVHEALYVMDRNHNTQEEIDSAVKFGMNFPMGIFELADFTGIDVIHKASVEMSSRDQKVLRQHHTVKEMFDDNKLGQKTGEGFYRYSDDKYERVALSRELAGRCDPLPLVANIMNNAAWLISHKASDEQEIEKAVKLGLGLKRPLFETAKMAGMKNIVSHLNSLASSYGAFYEPDPYLLTISQ